MTPRRGWKRVRSRGGEGGRSAAVAFVLMVVALSAWCMLLRLVVRLEWASAAATAAAATTGHLGQRRRFCWRGRARRSGRGESETLGLGCEGRPALDFSGRRSH
jgi:hypothetical protein